MNRYFSQSSLSCQSFLFLTLFIKTEHCVTVKCSICQFILADEWFLSNCSIIVSKLRLKVKMYLILPIYKHSYPPPPPPPPPAVLWLGGSNGGKMKPEGIPEYHSITMIMFVCRPSVIFCGLLLHE